MRIKPKQNVRWIMIDNSDQASHGPRMKVSMRSQTPNISKNTSHDKYIEIYRSKNNEIAYKGDLNKIKMDNKEYKAYVDLFIRNENLIRLAQDPTLAQYANPAFINDENMRFNNILIERVPNGDLIAFKYVNGKPIVDYKLNIRGERIL